MLPVSICFAATGDPITAPLLIGSGIVPHVRIAGNGDTAVSWLDYAASKQMLRWYRASGQAVTAPIVVNTKPIQNFTNSSLAVNANGAAVVSWMSSDVYVRAYKADKTPLTQPQVVNSLPSSFSFPFDPVVAIFPKGGYAVAYWRFDEDTALSDGVVLRRYAPIGQPLGTELPVNYVPGIDPLAIDDVGFNPSMAVLSDGQIAITWEDRPEPRFRLLNSYGLATKSYVELYYPGSPHEAGYGPIVAADPRGGFLIAWQATVSVPAGTQTQVVAQRFDASGTSLSGPVALTSGTDYEWPEALAIDRRGNFALVFRSYSAGHSTLRIYGANNQPLSPDIVLGGVDADVAVNPLDNFAVVWNAATPSANAIYLQRFRGVP